MLFRVAWHPRLKSPLPSRAAKADISKSTVAMVALSLMRKFNKIEDAGRHPGMPFGRSLHLPAEIEQYAVAAGGPDDLQCNRHCPFVKANRQRDSGKAQHIDESRLAAKRIQRLGRKPLRS